MLYHTGYSSAVTTKPNQQHKVKDARLLRMNESKTYVTLGGNSPSGKKNRISRSAPALLSLPCTPFRSSSIPNNARKLHRNFHQKVIECDTYDNGDDNASILWNCLPRSGRNMTEYQFHHLLPQTKDIPVQPYHFQTFWFN